ncbi:tetratricopeptide repeat protein [Dethiosulfatarculus sandiegensis]|uniref:GGDEF domain-containing protein n=1 Tax=Dethiosulfatarculus sandiegensis TaxID=1429043 RepID=A0A0D2HZK7_9BACT|nr:tetratricopeptide repeat protein [Dethiosulfatarculus sandiegensis]KIX15713.1 hypothetical protein X474_02615 [Dethiosulfatarculus sandiegensis]
MVTKIQGVKDSLSSDDLFRFEETFKPLFRRALSVGRVDLMMPPNADASSPDPLARAAAKGKAVYDEKGARLVVPLIEGGQVLALVVAWQVTAEQLHPAVNGFLASLMDASLEMVRLRLLAETDPITGLANEFALDEALTNALSNLSPSRSVERPALDQEQGEKGYCLLAVELAGINLLRERYGRLFGDKVVVSVAKKIKETLPQALAAARSGATFYVLLEGGDATGRDAALLLQRAVEALDLATPAREPWRARLRLGAAAVDSGSWEGGGLALEAAAVLKARAVRALAVASRLERDEILFFGEIVEKAGRLLEILPMNRVLVDLGRIHGLTDGERFQVLPGGLRSGKDPVLAKAEILVVKVGENHSVAEVTALLDPTFSLRSGDRLQRLGQKSSDALEARPETVLSLGKHKIKVVLDEVTGLSGHRSFLALYRAVCDINERFAVALIQLEGLEGMREVCGVVGADSLVSALAEAVKQDLPQDCHAGRFAPDTLGLIFPDMSADKAREQVQEIIGKVGEAMERPLRAGVSYAPCPGFEAWEIMDCASKALVHAGFLEPFCVVVFDAVSLNISGDTLFSQGRISEAVVEYEKALILDPSEVNVLNSLGVCYGHLGQAQKALECFEKALAAAPEDFMAYYNLGYALMSQGKLEQARGNLEKSLEINPGHGDTLFQLGCLAQTQGRLQEALENFKSAVKSPGCRQAVHRRLGEALAAAGHLQEAEEAFNRAVKANGNDAQALSSLAGLYLDRKANLEIALSLAKRASTLEPESARHQRVWARALVSLDRLDEASGLLKEAVSQYGKDPYMAVQRADLEALRGDLKLARKEYERALSLEPQLEAAKTGLEKLADDC